MKSRIFAIILAGACLVASCLPNLIINPTKETLITETVTLEESADEPSWGEIYKTPEAYQKAYEESVAAYQKQMEEILNNPQTANLTQLYQEAQKAQAGKNVKDVDYDGYGKIKVSYANGQSKTIDILKGAPSNQANETVTEATTEVEVEATEEAVATTPTPSPTPTVPAYEQIGYEVPLDKNFPLQGHLDNGLRHGDYELKNYKCVLISVQQPTLYDPYHHFIYEISLDLKLTNYAPNHGDDPYWGQVCIDSLFATSSIDEFEHFNKQFETKAPLKDYEPYIYIAP